MLFAGRGTVCHMTSFLVVRMVERERYLPLLDSLVAILLFGVGINMTTDTVPV